MSTVKVRQVAPGFHVVHLPLPMRPTIVNVYLVDGGSEWALFDTGMCTEESQAAFREALDIIGCPPERIGKIVCTHHHPDHFGTSGPYRKLTGARIYLHPLEAERMSFYLRKDRPPEATEFFERHGIPVDYTANVPSPAEFWAAMYDPAEPDVALADGDRIPIGEREVEVVWTPGHSPGHCVMLFRREGILIVGDHLLPKITPHVGIMSDVPQDPLGDFLASLRKVGDLPADLVLPAHGPVYDDPGWRARQLEDFHAYRMDVMLDVIRNRSRTAWEVALEAFDLTPESPYQQQFPATFETLAHLEHMRRSGRVRRIEEGPRLLWRALGD